MPRRKTQTEGRIRDHDYVEDDTFYEAFPRIRPASLGSLENFASRRMDGDLEYDEESLSDEDEDQPDYSTRRQSIRSRRASTFSRRRSGSKTPRRKSSKTAKGKQHYAHQRSEALKKAMYSGVTHSDMDVQTGRPPLMYQMGLFQWLWFQSTTKQRVLFLMIGFLLTIVLFNFIVAVLFFSSRAHIRNPYLCTTKNCEFLAKRIKSKLNRSVNPCDDFYAFVCGSSGVQANLSERDEKYWIYGFDEGNIVYDFDYSVSLGSMLKPTKAFPEKLVLTMYKGCLEERERKKDGLKPYFDVLKEFNLYNISLQSTLTPDHVIDSMARILSHSFLDAAIIRIQYYLDDDDKTIKSYAEPSTILQPFLRGGAVHRHGYRLYHDTIRSALSMVKDELNITDPEMYMLPHDMLCLDLYLRDQYIVEDADSLAYLIEIFGEQNFTHEGCDMGTNHTQVVQANFGQEGMKTTLNGSALIHRIRELGTPSGKACRVSDADPLLNNRTAKWFLPAVHELWKASSPLRLMRYFQWRILLDLSFDLNREMIDVITSIKRYSFSGLVTNCFYNLFRWLPFVAPNRFFQQIPEERLNEIETAFEDLTGRLKATYDTMTARSSFGQIEKLLNFTFTKKQRILFQHIIFYYSNTEEVPPVLFKATHFPTYRELYKNINLIEHDHVKNIITMGRRINEWRINPDFYNAFWDINPVYHTPILVNQLKTVYDSTTHSVRNYIPIGSVEVPFFRDGLAVSDASGLGLILGEAQERGFLLLLRSQMENNDYHLKTKMKSKGYTDKEVDEMKSRLIDYIQSLENQIHKDLEKWKIENISWGDIKDKAALNHLLDAVFMDEGRYEAVALMISNYLKESANEKEAKYVLRGLEDFSAKKLYYITLVNRRCEKLGRNKFQYITQFGPLSQSVRNNIQLSYQDDFSRTFACKLHSKMNPENKVYFHDRYLNITDDGHGHPEEIRGP